MSEKDKMLAGELYEKVCKNVYKYIYVNWDNKVKDVFDLYMEIIKNKERNTWKHLK